MHSRTMKSVVVAILVISTLLSVFGPLAYAQSGTPTAAAPAGPAPTPTRVPMTPKATGIKPADLKVVVMAGGPHPYFAPMEKAAADAKKDMGLGDVQYKVPQDWNLNTANQLIQSLVAQNFNGFALWPSDVNASNSTFDDLVAKGWPVISIAAVINQPSKASFALSTDVGNSAYIATQALIKALGGKGTIVHGTGYLKDLNSQKRMDAVKKAVDETNGAVKLLQTLADIDDQESADKAINSLMAAQAKNIDGIVTTAYVPSVVAATALRNLGDKRIKMIGIDDDQVVLDAIKDGFVDGTMSQNPYGQAYIACKVISELASGCVPKKDAPFHIDSGTLLITKDNVATYNDERVKLTKDIADNFQTKYLDCP
jgi:ribose transport system substrate-binding protein